jgi:hypothetical protein
MTSGARAGTPAIRQKPTTSGAALFAIALAAWWVFVFPVNQELAAWRENAGTCML